MKFSAIFALLLGYSTLGQSFSPAAPPTSVDLPEPGHNDTHVAVLPILDIGTSYILGQSHNNFSTGLISDDDPGPVQCGPDKECLDSSCCNSDGKCGFQDVHCRPKEPKKCISNCDAKAMCGVDSKDGKQKCGLNLCCSYYGWCGTNGTHCGDQDEKGFKTPCQKDFGKCEIVPPPSCGIGSGTATNGRRIAYYQSWNTRLRLCNRIWPNQINTTGLTHLNFAFASIDPKTYRIRPMYPKDVDLYPLFTALQNPKLQTWIAVGGWDFSDPGPTRETWSNMVSNQENRAAFVESALEFMKQYGFQGLDLDWEYPVTSDRGGRDDDTKNQVLLAQDLRKTFGDKYGISSILAPDYWYLRYMDPKALSEYVDWFNFMAYDLAGFWDADNPIIGAKIRPHTDLRVIEKDLLPLWFDGVDPKKVNLGLAYYGRGYTVSDRKCMQFDCAYKGPSPGALCTSFEGFMSNHEIDLIIKDNKLQPELMKDAAVKQITWNDTWIGYDDAETYAMKLAHANERCLGGSFIWSIDFGSGSGSGDFPDLNTPGNNETGPDPEDVYIPPGIWWDENPTVQCVPPCTLVIPPYTLDQMTTISWPPLTTTLLSYEGGTTSTVTDTVESLVGGVVTKVTVTYLTVGGASPKTITTTISVPPITTNKIEFWPVSVEPTDMKGNVTFAPQPRIRPPPVDVTMTPCLFTFLPAPYPHTFNPTFASPPVDDIPTVCPTETFALPVFPHPTIGIPLPREPRPKCTQPWCEDPPAPAPICNQFWCSTPTPITTSRSYRFPSTIHWKPDPPQGTCTAGCGAKYCEIFGCPDSETDKDKKKKGGGGGGGGGGGCHPKFPNVGCGCGPLGLPAPCPDGTGKGGKGGGGRCHKAGGCDPDGGGGGGGGGGGRCGSQGCDGGCGIHGCGGGCGIQGCGGNCMNGQCNPCPLQQCGGPGCQGQQCGPVPPAGSCKDGPCPPNPTGGDPNKPKCDEDKKTTVTDYWVSCTKFNPTSSSCTTTRTVTLTGCALLPTTTTTNKGPACTKGSLNLDDDQGDDQGDPHLKPSPTQAPSQKPTPTSDPFKCENGCGCCNNYYQKCLREDCDDPQSEGCINKCVADMCWGPNTPTDCRYGKGCASEFCPKSPPSCENNCGCCNDYYQRCLRENCKDQQSAECINKCNEALCSAKDSPEVCHTENKCGSQNDLCPRKSITKKWKIRIHQAMEYKWSNVYWTLIDSNGDEAGHGEGTPIMSDRKQKDRSLPYKVDFSVRDPTDKDRTNIEFILDVTVGRNCKPTWTTGQTGRKGARPQLRECVKDLIETLGCTIPERIEWKPWKGGFERYFECWFDIPQTG